MARDDTQDKGWFDLSGHQSPHAAVTLGAMVLVSLGALIILKHLFGPIRAGGSAEVEV